MGIDWFPVGPFKPLGVLVGPSSNDVNSLEVALQQTCLVALQTILIDSAIGTIVSFLDERRFACKLFCVWFLFRRLECLHVHLYDIYISKYIIP